MRGVMVVFGSEHVVGCAQWQSVVQHGKSHGRAVGQRDLVRSRAKVRGSRLQDHLRVYRVLLERQWGIVVQSVAVALDGVTHAPWMRREEEASHMNPVR